MVLVGGDSAGPESNTGVIFNVGRPPLLDRCWHVHSSHLRVSERVYVAAFRVRVLGIAVMLGPIEDQ